MIIDVFTNEAEKIKEKLKSVLKDEGYQEKDLNIKYIPESQIQGGYQRFSFQIDIVRKPNSESID